ncbi:MULTISPECIES: hypothetical protein [unclassified Caballeronia]|uniref:hypothetical protein n=1 Tax=unclassified Caballeronia TaxID=2646786 RepID=UPI001F2EA93B|nr:MULTISPECIES: hypothetical protein [unclassified Caballeronia]MCE4547340.1 hypothetical protein [Caballeronia sp. PC1]MCE4575324.1 hypothetical protein [Caballeronia sp. CLC5]
MDTRDSNIVGAFELRMIDADIAHIRLAIEAVLHEPNSALPLLYWRRRLEQLLLSRHLLRHQFSAVADLLTRLEKLNEDLTCLAFSPEQVDERRPGRSSLL